MIIEASLSPPAMNCIGMDYSFFKAEKKGAGKSIPTPFFIIIRLCFLSFIWFYYPF